MISFRIHNVFHFRKRMCHFTGCPGPLLHVSQCNAWTLFGPGGLANVQYVTAGLGLVGDSASWVVEAPRISLESADLCLSPLKPILNLVLTFLKSVNSHRDSAWSEEKSGS